MNIGDRVRLVVPWTQANGSLATMRGIPQWTNSNPVAYRLVTDKDALFAVVERLIAAETEITVTARVNRLDGSGERQLTAVGVIQADGTTRGDFQFVGEPMAAREAELRAGQAEHARDFPQHATSLVPQKN